MGSRINPRPLSVRMKHDNSGLRSEVPAFRDATRRFYAKEITVKEYKGISGRFGSYAQRGGERNMVRLRFAGGAVSADKAAFIAECITRYGIDMVHLTTCQAVQLHNLTGEAAADIVDAAFDHGIITLGGGGDCPRNVTASPLSGIEPGENFDVLPYAEIAESYLLSILDSIKLPRKLKVGFSNSSENTTHVTFRDLGFASAPDGTFDVYCAGGLGNNPLMGIHVATGVDPSKMLYHVRAMVDVFVKHGNYENRSKARTRYMQESMGEDALRAAYGEAVDALLSSGGLDISADDRSVHKAGCGKIQSDRVHPQKQDGLYYVSYHPLGGDPSPSRMVEMAALAADIPEAGIRVSTDGTMYIINLTAEEAVRALDVTDDGARTLFESSVSCVGATICQIGLRDSRGLLDGLIEMERSEGFADGVLPRINISGCTSSCGAHQIGVIGLNGTTKQIGGSSHPCFNLHVNGSHLQGEERFGEPLGALAEEDVAEFLRDVGRAVVASGMTYRAWYDADGGEIRRIAAKYII